MTARSRTTARWFARGRDEFVKDRVSRIRMVRPEPELAKRNELGRLPVIVGTCDCYRWSTMMADDEWTRGGCKQTRLTRESRGIRCQEPEEYPPMWLTYHTNSSLINSTSWIVPFHEISWNYTYQNVFQVWKVPRTTIGLITIEW